MQISLSQEEANPLALVSRIIILKFTWESLVFDKFCKDSKTQWARFRVRGGLSLISDPEVYKANHSTSHRQELAAMKEACKKGIWDFPPNRSLSPPSLFLGYCDNFVEEDTVYVFYTVERQQRDNRESAERQ